MEARPVESTRKETGSNRDENTEIDDGQVTGNMVLNDTIWEMAGVVEASKNAREKRLGWYKHMMRRKESHIVRISRWSVGGTEEGRRGGGGRGHKGDTRNRDEWKQKMRTLT